jgi:hypothetical protein
MARSPIPRFQFRKVAFFSRNVRSPFVGCASGGGGIAARRSLPVGHAVIQRIMVRRQAVRYLAHHRNNLLHDVAPVAAGRAFEEVTDRGVDPRGASIAKTRPNAISCSSSYSHFGMSCLRRRSAHAKMCRRSRRALLSCICSNRSRPISIDHLRPARSLPEMRCVPVLVQ